MSIRTLKWISVLVPPFIIGSFELIRHDFLLHHISMELGNWLIIGMTFLLSYVFSMWLFGMIEKMNSKLSEERAQRAVFMERERLAGELHDQIAQTLFFLNVNLKQGNVDEARKAVSEMDHHVRQAIFSLRSTPENTNAFVDRIIKWIAEWREITGITITLDLRVPEGYFSPTEEVQIFAIIQEAFTNIRKHSFASHTELRIIAEPERWFFSITDDGMGLPNPMTIMLVESDSSVIGSGKYGLELMHKRSCELGAEDFMFQNHQPNGVKLSFTVLGSQRRNRSK